VRNVFPTIIGDAESRAGFRAEIINYAKQIEDLFAKMEGVRSHVLPPNREAIDDYFNEVWDPVHTLTAAVISLQSEPSSPDKFKPYLEAEEARLAANLKAVDYTIDGTDTLTLITGVGRVEKVRTMRAHSAVPGSSVVDPLSITVCADEAALRDHADHEDQGG
jgi:hypothetical protein